MPATTASDTTPRVPRIIMDKLTPPLDAMEDWEVALWEGHVGTWTSPLRFSTEPFVGLIVLHFTASAAMLIRAG